MTLSDKLLSEYSYKDGAIVSVTYEITLLMFYGISCDQV